MSHDEAERLRRLREKQLSARDPHQADRRRNAIIRKRPRETFSLGAELRRLPAKVTWMLWGGVIGLFFGLFLATIIGLAFHRQWFEVVALVSILFCGLIGHLFGSVKDSGREDWR